jgi:hypothetical protein
VQESGDLKALGRLDMRAQGDAELVGLASEALNVAPDLVDVDDGKRGVGVCEGVGAGSSVHRVISSFWFRVVRGRGLADRCGSRRRL